jgi:hypothetical protein
VIEEAERLDLILRAWRLRQARKIRLILADQGRIYVCASECDPWGTAQQITWREFRDLVEGAERQSELPNRKSAARERRAQSLFTGAVSAG